MKKAFEEKYDMNLEFGREEFNVERIYTRAMKLLVVNIYSQEVKIAWSVAGCVYNSRSC